MGTSITSCRHSPVSRGRRRRSHHGGFRWCRRPYHASLLLIIFVFLFREPLRSGEVHGHEGRWWTSWWSSRGAHWRRHERCVLFSSWWSMIKARRHLGGELLRGWRGLVVGGRRHAPDWPWPSSNTILPGVCIELLPLLLHCFGLPFLLPQSKLGLNIRLLVKRLALVIR